MDFYEKIKILKKKGYEESCPERRGWIFFKYPFVVEISPVRIKSFRLDKEYNFNGKIIGDKNARRCYNN